MKALLLLFILIGGCLSLSHDYVTILNRTVSHIQSQVKGETLTPNIDLVNQLYQSIFRLNIGDHLLSALSQGAFDAHVGVSEKCRNDTTMIINGIKSNQPWSIKFLDAVGRPESGISKGAFYWLGDFDICMSQLYHGDWNVTNVQGHYCLASAPLILSPTAILSINEGVCAPRSCSSEDVKELINTGIDILSLYLQIPQLKSIRVSAVQCRQPRSELPWSDATIASVCVLAVLTGIVVLATVYHQCYHWTQDGTIPYLARSFITCCTCCISWRQRASIHLLRETQINVSSDEEADANTTYTHDNVRPRVLGPVVEGGSPSLRNAGRVSPSMFLEGQVQQQSYGRSGVSSVQDRNLSESTGNKPGISLKQRFHDVILSFSLIQNVTKLMSDCFASSKNSRNHQTVNMKPLTEGKMGKSQPLKEPDLACLHGIRFLSLTWVILGHTFAFGYTLLNNVLSFSDDLLHRFHFQVILNGTFSVDTFFVLSGLLTSYLFYRNVKAHGSPLRINWLLFYVHRYLRLTPPYLLLLFIEYNLFGYVGEGPIYPQTTGIEQYCNETWWTNALYINNLVKSNQTCMGWGWYLANDMQFYIISPIILIPLFYSSTAGVIIALLVIAGSVTATGIISYQNSLPVGTMGLTQGGMESIYIKPWCRISPYLVGVLTGHFLAKTRGQVALNGFVQAVLWLVSAALCGSVVYGLYDSEKGVTDLSVDVAAFYNSASRLGWSLGVAWLIVACVCGMGGWINKLLSWSAFVPLSRLSYCAYLVHPLVLFFIYTSQMTIIKSTLLSMSLFYVAALVFSYALAFVLSMLVEAPTLGLEKTLLAGRR